MTNQSSKSIFIHPNIDNGINPTDKNFKGGTLQCKCDKDKVTIAISKQCSNTHVCGCSKCWKPKGVLFAQISTIPKANLKIIANNTKLHILDKTTAIQRYFCQHCGVHMYGRIENKEHPFFGLDFIHTELSTDKGWEAPTFAAFVSSIIETGTDPKDMKNIRQQLKNLGLTPYDCLSPELMDAIAISVYKRNK